MGSNNRPVSAPAVGGTKLTKTKIISFWITQIWSSLVFFFFFFLQSCSYRQINIKNKEVVIQIFGYSACFYAFHIKDIVTFSVSILFNVLKIPRKHRVSLIVKQSNKKWRISSNVIYANHACSDFLSLLRIVIKI